MSGYQRLRAKSAASARPRATSSQSRPALPACWRTLHELSFLKPETLLALIEDGTVHSKLEGAEATTLRTDRSTTQHASVDHRTPSARTGLAINSGFSDAQSAAIAVKPAWLRAFCAWLAFLAT